MTVQEFLDESDAIAEIIKTRPSVGGKRSKKKKMHEMRGNYEA